MVFGMDLARVGRTPVAAAAPPARFGVVADVGTRYGVVGQAHKPMGLLAGSGARWVKEEFRWDALEPSRGRWTWDRLDEAVNAERSAGLEILGLLDFTAGWAVGEARPASTTPPPHDLWTNYVARTVGRYKDRVHAWEVWNEPNEPTFWSGTKEEYVALLRVTYDTIKRVDPSALILGPAITGIDEQWLAAMPWDKFDVLALHLYTEPDFLNDRRYSYYNQGLPNFQRVLARFPTKPIWITEFGFSSQSGKEPWFVDNEGAQARGLVQQIAETLAYPGLPIERVMPYVFNDHDGFELVRDWSTPKPAYHAYRAATERLEGATGRGRFNAGPGIFAFRFERDGRQIDVVWSNGGGEAAIPSGGDAEVYDLYGTRRTVGRADNAVRFAVGADPVYVVHAPAGGAVDGAVGAFSGDSRIFAETGKGVRGPFLNHWTRNGGLALYGFPISGELLETLGDGKVYLVQYFERARFEYHPQNTAPYDVLLGQFGRQLHPLYPPVPDCRCGRFFAETGHNVVGGFLTFWEAHGGLAQFGYPITDQVTETLENGEKYTVQWFERARLEYHPKNVAPYDIQLGQFGRQIYTER